MNEKGKTVKEQRMEPRDPGEAEQKKAIEVGLADKPEVIADGKCPTCGRDHVNS